MKNNETGYGLDFPTNDHVGGKQSNTNQNFPGRIKNVIDLVLSGESSKLEEYSAYKLKSLAVSKMLNFNYFYNFFNLRKRNKLMKTIK